MNESRDGQINGTTRVRFERRGHASEPTDVAALGDVARDVMDHASLFVRDELELLRLEGQRYGERLKKDVAPRAALGVGAALCGLLAAMMGLVALFLGLAHVIGSIAWTFVLFAVLFGVATAILLGMRRRPAARPRAEDVLPRVSYLEAHPHDHDHEHARVPGAHQALVEQTAAQRSR